MKEKKSPSLISVFSSSSFRIVLIYFTLSFLWIFFSDELLFSFFKGIAAQKFISILKGGLFVIISSLLLYRLIKKAVSQANITEMKLLASEQYSRMLFEKSSIGLALTRMDGKFTDVNPAYADIIGRSIDETLKLDYWEITPGHYMEQEKQQLINLEKTGHYGPYEKEYIHKDGRLIPVRLQGSLIERGGEKFIWSSVENISERRLSEELLRRTREFTREFMDYSPSVVYASDIEGRLILVNKQFELVTGSTRENIIGREREHFLPAAIAERHRINDKEVISSKRAITFEEENIQPDGKHFYISSKFPLLNNKGEIYAVGGVSTDITERKNAEEALKKSEEKFYKAFQNSPDAMIISRVSDGYIVEVNESFYSISGYSRNEVIGSTTIGMNFWNSDLERRKYMSLLEEKGKVTEFETVFRTKSGELRNFILAGELFELNGEVHALGMIHDITDRTRAEEALRHAHKQIENTLENMTDGFVALDRNWIYTHVNSRAGKMFGRPAKELIGKHIWTEFPEGIGQPFYNNYYLAVKTQNNINFEDYYEPWGRWFENRVIPSGDGLSIFFQDITERKNSEAVLLESEEKFRKLVDEMPNGVLIIDHEGMIIGWNRAQEKITGLSNLEVLGKSSWDIQLSLMPGRTITEDLRGETKKIILDLFSDGNASYLNTPLERTIQRPDGSRCIIESTVFIYRTREKSIAVTISTDITSRKMIEEDLRKSHSQLRSLTSHIEKIREDERAAIAREMHDELGQILTSLKMNIAFTRKAVEAEHLEIKRENLLHELQTMNSSIDTAVAEVRKLITQLRPDLLDKLGLLAALEWYSEEFQKSTKINCSLKSDGAALSLSPEKDLAVFRIVQEAMTNIVKYAGASSVNIRLECGDNKLIVEISDNGKGISEEEIKGEKSFGLMGMRERAVLIGGKLEITGVPGRGTLVRLVLNM